MENVRGTTWMLQFHGRTPDLTLTFSSGFIGFGIIEDGYTESLVVLGVLHAFPKSSADQTRWLH